MPVRSALEITFEDSDRGAQFVSHFAERLDAAALCGIERFGKLIERAHQFCKVIRFGMSKPDYRVLDYHLQSSQSNGPWPAAAARR